MWLVSGGRAHQITGERQALWAQVMFGLATDQDAADWEATGPTVVDLYGGPGGIERVARGLAADPLGAWGVTVTEPTNPFPDFQVVQWSGQYYLVSSEGDGRAWRITGEGSFASAVAIWGDPVAVDSFDWSVAGDVTGTRPGDLFGPNEIEALSGLDPVNPGEAGPPPDISLPVIRPVPLPDPTGVTGPQPDLSRQVLGATADRTPGLRPPDVDRVPEEDPPPPPDEGVDPSEPQGGQTGAADGGGQAVNRPDRRPPDHSGTAVNRPDRRPPEHVVGPVGRPDRTPPGQIGGPVNRPDRTRSADRFAPGPFRPVQPKRRSALPPPRLEHLERFAARTGIGRGLLAELRRKRES